MTAPVLCIAGEDDQVTTKGSAKGLVKLVGSEDTEFSVVPGGHIGVVVGSHARRELWPKIASWLTKRADPARAEAKTA